MQAHEIFPGMKVRVRSWDDMALEFGVSASAGYVVTPGFIFLRSMQRFCGREYVVVAVRQVASSFTVVSLEPCKDDNSFSINHFKITPEMLEPVNAEIVDQIPYEDFVSILNSNVGLGDVDA